MIRSLLILSALLATAAAASAQVPTAGPVPAQFDVFVVAGQSNAVGYGGGPSPPVPPGVAYLYHAGALVPVAGDPLGVGTGSAWPAFAAEYHARTGRGVVLVAAAVGGTPLVAGMSDVPAPLDWSPTGVLFPAAVEGGALALAAATGQGLSGARLVGWLWSQGEADAVVGIDGGRMTEGDYRSAYRALQARFAAAVPGGRLLVAQTGRWRWGDTAGFAAVRRVQAEEAAPSCGGGGGTPAELAFVAAVTFPERGLMRDDIHYSQTGLNEMGRAMAACAAAGVLPPTDPPRPVEPPREDPPPPAFGVYPNPAHGRVTIVGAAGLVEVLDVLGRVVLRGDETLDVSGLAPGRYVVRSGEAMLPLTVRR